jgi:PAS domain S-box-containing protein
MPDNDTDFHDSPSSLREQAEAKLRAAEAKTSAGLSPEETQRVLHELQVHQIELELQNEELRRAQAELEESRMRYLDLYDLAPVGYVTLSQQGLILEANLTAAELLGVARGALVQQPLTRFILPEDQDIYYRHRKHLVETGAPQTSELRLARPDASLFWAQVQATVLPDADGVPICRTVISDITARKQTEAALHESARRFRLALKNAPVTVASQDRDLRFTWAYNQRTVRPADVIGKTDTDVFPPESAARLMILKRQVLETGAEVHQQLWLASGSQRVFLDLFLEPSRDEAGQVTGIEIATVDLTAQRLAEEALQARQAELTVTNEELHAQQEALAATNDKLSLHQQELTAINAELRTRTTQLAQTNTRLHRLNRTLVARSNSARALMETSDETDYLKAVCRIVVEGCGYPMAWIGYAEADEAQTVRPVAHAGLEAGYLETLQITWADSERGRGPTGTAIRTGRPSACRNMLTDPQFAPWREQALKRGYAASLVLPLLAQGQAFGTLTLYFTQPDSFTEDEVVLLSGLADDVANGIQTIRLRAAHAQAEAALQTAHDELEKRIADRTAELAARTRDLQAANARLQAEIVERQQAERQLRLQALALQAAANGIVITDPQGTILWSNPAFTALTGYSADEAFGQTPRLVRSGQHPPAFYAQMWKTILAGQVWQGEMVNRRQDGTLYPEEQTITPVRDETGHLSHFIAIKQDITERKQAEDRLRQNALRSEAIADISQALAEAKFDDHAACDAVARVTAALYNDACLIVPFSPDRQVLTVEALHHPDPATEAQLRLHLPLAPAQFEAGPITRHILQTNQPLLVPVIPSALGLEWIRPDYRPTAEQIGLQSMLVVPLHAQGRCMGQLLLLRLRPEAPYSPEDQLTVQNLADRAALALVNAQLYRNLENALAQEQAIRQQLIQAEKLGALGRMVSSVAHEINNPLQTITNCLYLTHEELSPESPIHTYLEMANSETQRLVRLVAQLRELYRPHTVSPETADLVQLLQNVQTLMARQLRSGQVQWLQPANLPGYSVTIVSDRLTQVFINVVTNAIEAMQPAGGQLLVDVAPSADGRQVGVSFKDTGPGIGPEHLSRLFEPFFSTKSQGLGLGLAICYEIAQQHGGQITAESQPGQGAVFTIWLPLAQPVEGGTTQKPHGDLNDATH